MKCFYCGEHIPAPIRYVAIEGVKQPFHQATLLRDCANELQKEKRPQLRHGRQYGSGQGLRF